MELITDRTQAHVARLKKLQALGWANLSDSQKTEYTGYAAKGAYNYTDLNRVETAVAEIAPYLGLNLVTKTNWTVWDIPVRTDMDRYLSNIARIRTACPDNNGIPQPPSSMSNLTYEGANNIEKILIAAYDRIERGYRCGELITGEV